jgi:hypothetical protein
MRNWGFGAFMNGKSRLAGPLTGFLLAVVGSAALAESFARGQLLRTDAMGALQSMPRANVTLVLKVLQPQCLLVVRTATDGEGAISLRPSQLTCQGLNVDVSDKLESQRVVLPANNDTISFVVKEGFTL